MLKYIRVIKYVIAIVLVVVATVAISVGVAIPIAKQNAANASASISIREAGYMYNLTDNEKSKFVTTTLADGKMARLQVVLELDPALAPKDQKVPDRTMLVLQDTLLKTIRELKSSDLTAGNQEIFKKKIADAAGKVLGKRAVMGVYLIGATVQFSGLEWRQAGAMS